ncbi:hypothetical protein J7643_14380 [bacterium]|nr:hypothetical protein [bacterium]
MRRDTRSGPPEPGQMLLLSAGPGAGKTRLLRRWERALVLPTLYLRLTPEDRDPAVLRHRLLRGLSRCLPESSLGLCADLPLGTTLASALPPLALLLDDFHFLAGSQAEGQMAAFLLGLPQGATVVLASRHRFDDSLALAAEDGARDDLLDPERPGPEDLATLPDRLRAWALALGLVGEASSSPEVLELVRRNVAVETAPDRFALRPAWGVLAREVRVAFADAATWDAVVALIEAFKARHRWTDRHGEIASLVAQVPAIVRAERPELLAIEAQQWYEEGAHAEALACFERALDLNPAALELVGWRIAVLAACDRATAWEVWREHRHALAAEMPTWALALEAQLQWYEGDFAAVETTLRRLLEQPIDGDRFRARQHLMAMYSLCELSATQFDTKVDQAYLQRMADLCARWNLTERLPWVIVARQNAALQDLTRVQPPELLAEVSNAVCAGALRTWVLRYLYNLAWQTQVLHEPELALKLFQLCERLSLNVQLGLGHMTLTIRWAQIEPLADLGRMWEAKARHDDYLRHFPTGLQHDVAVLQWAKICLSRRDLDGAGRALAACAPAAAKLRRRHHLYQEALRAYEGDVGALERMGVWLDSPEGESVRGGEVRLLQRLGLVSGPALFRLSAFGALQLARAGQSTQGWSRRKAMHLLAYLVLHPAGLPAAELAEKLFESDGETTPLQALHQAAHALRQTLKGIGGDGLIDASSGIFRLDWERIAFCDLREFDAFYQRARSLEGDGHRAMAAVFYQVALCFARGELFENLPEDFAEHRAAYRRRVRYAQAFAERHAP